MDTIIIVILAINTFLLIYISHQLDDINEVLRRPYIGESLPVRETGK